MHSGSEVGKVGPEAEEEKPPWQPGAEVQVRERRDRMWGKDRREHRQLLIFLQLY